ncbi:SMC-Scp complex subunit ScpB [Trichlorobacter lovleyi]|uniref:SMC-Scp complex subunit ScpB n=1 Tax=Trichlorobacter lovleyi TaxID=313985 RepID=UPI0023F38F8C|nr:SMC-Scp complex subunit ScpB [Trichlorobacter lovleyi]
MHFPSLNAIIEGLLFVSEGPMTLDRLTELLPDYERASVRLAVQELRDDYEQRGSGVHLVEVAGGWQLRTVPELMPYLSRMVKGRPARFSQSALETLAIVAYRQPITRQEIEYLRGVDTGAVLKTLLEKRLVKILGKKDIPGRPIIYGTTREFLEVFNLKDLKGLPTLREIQSLDEVPIFEVQEELPLGGEQRGES